MGHTVLVVLACLAIMNDDGALEIWFCLQRQTDGGEPSSSFHLWLQTNTPLSITPDVLLSILLSFQFWIFELQIFNQRLVWVWPISLNFQLWKMRMLISECDRPISSLPQKLNRTGQNLDAPLMFRIQFFLLASSNSCYGASMSSNKE
jgi:hypothetical protein